MTTEAELIINEIKKTAENNADMGRVIIISVKPNSVPDDRSYDFNTLFYEDLDCIESTYSMRTLNEVIRWLHENNYMVDLQCDY